jgi:putative membrane protein
MFMQFFFWLAFLVMIGLAIFAIQNSTAPTVVMKFLLWKFETSLIYTILGSIGSGIILTLLLLVPVTIRASLRARNLRKEIENLEREIKNLEGSRSKGP